jgi:hypothetical protein
VVWFGVVAQCCSTGPGFESDTSQPMINSSYSLRVATWDGAWLSWGGGGRGGDRGGKMTKKTNGQPKKKKDKKATATLNYWCYWILPVFLSVSGIPAGFHHILSSEPAELF